MKCPGDSDNKESPSNMGDQGLLSGSGRSPGEGNGYPLQYSRLGEFQGQRSLVGHSPRGHGELDTTKRRSDMPGPGWGGRAVAFSW